MVDSPIGAQTATEERPFLLDVSTHFSDPDGDALSFAAAGLPMSFTMDQSGILSGTPDAVDTSTSPFDVSVTADDGLGGTVTDIFTLTVQPPIAGDLCTEVLGFSQTGQWYVHLTLPWQGKTRSGADVVLWADPNDSVWNTAVENRVCDQNQVERVVFNISSGEENIVWEDEINSVIVNIRDKYPAVQQIVLQPVVGGPNGGPCFAGGGAQVRATVNFPTINAAIANVAGGDVLVGLAPTLADCSQYSDQQGHITVPGGQFVADQVEDFYTNEFQGTAEIDPSLN